MTFAFKKVVRKTLMRPSAELTASAIMCGARKMRLVFEFGLITQELNEAEAEEETSEHGHTLRAAHLVLDHVFAMDPFEDPTFDVATPWRIDVITRWPLVL
eukprot:CAMPEP_0179116104 /NCGR_PEP_ID=MMETSP0796-20121207/54440_1 /TAXON_ID=73915 /ORGANISM="Pyrodinium bahamense, Strain pbaha01" /LENGTH=100 /DNA_ID=CAMNT_0020814369 /DNA_START=366 /DNA_END=667 /DNA_ORIENTATION=+